MTKLKQSLLAGVVIAALAGAAYGQAIINRSLNGTTTIEGSMNGPGGQLQDITVAQVRNATALKTFSGSGAQTYTASVNDSTLYWVGTAPTTWTITTPALPNDGEIITLATDTTLTTMVTLTANTGQSLNSTYTNQTISAKGSVEFQYSLATTKWYELR